MPSPTPTQVSLPQYRPPPPSASSSNPRQTALPSQQAAKASDELIVVEPARQQKQQNRHKRNFHYGLNHVHRRSQGHGSLPLIIMSSDQHPKTLTVDTALKLVKQFIDLSKSERISQVTVALRTLQNAYTFTQNGIGTAWIIIGPTYKSPQAVAHFDTVSLLSIYVDYRPQQGWNEGKNRSQLVDVQVTTAQRRGPPPNRKNVTMQVMGIRDIYGGISYLPWQRHGSKEAPRALPDIADLRQDFPQIPMDDNAKAKTEIMNLIKTGTIKVCRRTSANASTGFVYVLDWKSREGSPSRSSPLVGPASSPRLTSTVNVASARGRGSSPQGSKRQDRKESPNSRTGTSASAGTVLNASMTRVLPAQSGRSVDAARQRYGSASPSTGLR